MFRPKYSADKSGRFIIENYNWASPFSNFFPGIAGKWGIPLWCYYVSRAQGIICMGIRDKDHPVLEFQSFNKALQSVSKLGFRTFIKLSGAPIYEPFQKTGSPEIKQHLIVSPHELEISDLNEKINLETNVLYYPLVNQPIGGIIRRLRIKNTGKKPVSIEFIDGLPRILPYGIDQHCVQVIARHIEGMIVANDVKGIPVFRLKQSHEDTEKISYIAGGNFYMSFDPDDENARHGRYIVDPFIIFGDSEVYDFPWKFLDNPSKKLLSMEQIKTNKTACAMTLSTGELKPGEELTLFSIVGNGLSDKHIDDFTKKIKERNFFIKKRKENKNVIDRIQNESLTVSAYPEFDTYVQQTFLDNVIRGGRPLMFRTADRKSAFYLYSRQNGDLERDYHYFILEPGYLSQGTGHYRSVNQNRRCDTWFFPEVEDCNIITFLNLIQTDGYNPLEVNQLTYSVLDMTRLKRKLGKIIKNKKKLSALLDGLSKQFTPGEIIRMAETHKIKFKNPLKLIDTILAYSKENEVGGVHEGYWVDHWFYNLDLIDNFLTIYPDRIRELLIEHRVYTFYDNPDIIRPRTEKYILMDGKIRQYDAVYRDRDKVKLMSSRKNDPCKARTSYGKGKIYKTNLLVKLLCIVINRIATLDPGGIGIEMEAGKPGWNDSMNGLPGILGSSLNETLELEKACRQVLDYINRLQLNDNFKVKMFEDLYFFMRRIDIALKKRLKSKRSGAAYIYWDESNTVKEHYRNKTKFGVSRDEVGATAGEIREFLEHCILLTGKIYLSENRKKVFHPCGVCYTYFINEAVKHSNNKIRKFRQRPVALFLEGAVHFMKINPSRAKRIYAAVRKSNIYDKKLKMYKACESLEKEPFEIGRVKAWGRGWIENESVYTHMEYKYLLEILRAGLYDEFFREIKNTCVCFMRPEVYGRSIFENCSFIVSSAFPDKRMVGRAFQPRLSGVTGEMVNMWIIMTAGHTPFFLDDNNNLNLKLSPVLSKDFFTREKRTVNFFKKDGGVIDYSIPANSFAFKFLGRTLVIYHNPKRKNTYGKRGVNVEGYKLLYSGGKEVNIKGSTIGTENALDIRAGSVERIDAYMKIKKGE